MAKKDWFYVIIYNFTHISRAECNILCVAFRELRLAIYCSLNKSAVGSAPPCRVSLYKAAQKTLHCSNNNYTTKPVMQSALLAAAVEQTVFWFTLITPNYEIVDRVSIE